MDKQIKSFSSPKVGDEYKDNDDNSRFVLGICGRIIFLSCCNMPNEYGRSFTKENLIELNYTIVQDEPKKEKTKLQFEDHNFRINSDGWKKITVDNKEYLVNPEKDIWELLHKDFRGEQLFTFQAMMRETTKAGKRVPTDKEFELFKTKDDMKNIIFSGYRNTNGTFYHLMTTATFWSSSVSDDDAWRRSLYSSHATVYRNVYDQMSGFSVRCLLDYTIVQNKPRNEIKELTIAEICKRLGKTIKIIK